jgi:hypothetical protein
MAFNNSLFSTPKQPAQPAIAYAVCEDGHVVDILLQNGGAGYLAPPRVDLVGDGSGATAEATIDTVTGTVTGITITNPGSGYWPVPIISYNGQVYPVPPGKTGAIVLITTGYIENMYYR